MSEQRLQSDIVRKFSELYTNRKGQLFHVSNERNNSKQAFIAQSIGIVPGVSDLIYFESENELLLQSLIKFGKTNKLTDIIISGIVDIIKHSNICKVYGIELKELNSRHKVDHVKAQLSWAKTLEECGGEWSLCRTVDEAINFIKGEQNQGLTIEEVEKMISENGNKKTIKF